MCRLRVLVGLLGTLLFSACYSPNISQGGFACGSGSACPQGFHCVNDLCYSTDVDACAPVTPVSETCSAGAPAGQACNPGCQTGCRGCDWCGVENGVAACLAPSTGGTIDVGGVCDPTMSNQCQPGLYCQPECGKGRCYQFCDSSAMPPNCAHCDLTAKTMAGTTLPFDLCELPTVTCDPVAETGCSLPFACFSNGSGTECDCPGTTARGGSCMYLDDCQSGDTCSETIPATATMKAQSFCLQTCAIRGSQCPTGTSCNPVGSTYGYCN